MNQYAAYFAIESKLKKQGFEGDRSELVSQYTNDQKSKLSDLTSWEYQEFLKWLNRTFLSNQNNAPVKPFIDNPVENNQRRKIIALFAQMGYVKDGKADMYRINGWCMSHGHLKTMINDYHGSDLTKLVFQAERVYKTFIETL